MSANVETMVSVREVPWHGLGTIVQEAMTSEEALELSGLNWNVESKPIFTDEGIEIPGYRANTRDSDNSVLGIVSDRYKIVQNRDAFSFTDALVAEGDTRYETAGSLRDGKQIWLLAKTPTAKICGDDVDPYICFTNSHDGFGSIKVCMTPIRVVCNNTLNLALNSASRSWNTRHIGDIDDRIEEAKETLSYVNNYMKRLDENSDRLANTKISDDEIAKFIAELFPIAEDATDRVKNNTMNARESYTACYFAPDITKFQNTAWGLVNATSDFATHVKSIRNTSKAKENRWANLLNGNVIIDTTFLKMMEFAKIDK